VVSGHSLLPGFRKPEESNQIVSQHQPTTALITDQISIISWLLARPNATEHSTA
jgi:hypothetical protein